MSFARLVLPLLLSLFVIIISAPVRAAAPNPLYQVREPLNGLSAETRRLGLQRAFVVLVGRLTGEMANADLPALAEVRENPQQWVSRYGVVEGRILQVSFDPATVNRGLRKVGLQVWGGTRPELLVWWLTEEGGSLSLIADGQSDAALVRAAASYRGAVVRFPLGDLDEQLAVTPETLVGPAAEDLEAVSERYNSGGQLRVYAQSLLDTWQAAWQLRLNGKEYQGQLQAASREALADAVMQEVQRHLATRAAQIPKKRPSRIRLEVEGTQLAGYAQLDRVLEPLNGQLVSADGDRLIYRVSVSAERLRAQLRSIRLQEVGFEEASAPGRESVLRCRW